MTPHPHHVENCRLHGNCMSPVWHDGDRCLIAWYPVTWPAIAALHGKFCVYDFRGNLKLRASGGILDHVEAVYPDGEQAAVFRTLNPTDHETIRKIPLRLLTMIGQVYAEDEADLIPDAVEPEPPPEIVEVEIREIPARKIQPVFEAVPATKVSRNRINAKIN